jgi:hypothetical protein
VDHLGVGVAAQQQGAVVVPGRDPLGQLACPGDALHEGHGGHLVVAHPDQPRSGLGGGGQEFLDGRVAKDGAHRAVEGAGRAAALHVAEDGDPDVLAQLLGE